MILDAERAATYMHPEVKLPSPEAGRWRAWQISRSLTALAAKVGEGAGRV